MMITMKNAIYEELSQFSCSVVSDSLRPHESQHARLPCPSPAPGVHSDSRPSSHWCHPAISSSVVPFSSCPQSLPASGSFPMSQLVAWGGQSTGASALASFLPKKSQGWSPSEWTGWISLQSQGLSRVFSNTTVQKHEGLKPYPDHVIHNPHRFFTEDGSLYTCLNKQFVKEWSITKKWILHLLKLTLPLNNPLFIEIFK